MIDYCLFLGQHVIAADQSLTPNVATSANRKGWVLFSNAGALGLA